MSQNSVTWFADIFETPDGYDIDFVWDKEAEYTYSIQRHDPMYDMTTRKGRRKAVLDAYINCLDVAHKFL